MARAFARTFYSSKAWKECAKSFLQSKSYLCERCGKPAAIAHHKTYLQLDNINNADIALNWANLEALCTDCHAAEHSRAATAAGLMFDASGNLVKT